MNVEVLGRVLLAFELPKFAWAAPPERSRGERLSFAAISARLAEAGHVNERGQPFNAQSVRAMVEGPQRRQRRASDTD